MDLTAHCGLHLVQNIIHVLVVVTLKHQDVVRRVDQAVACYFVHELNLFFVFERRKVVLHYFLILSLHLYVVDFGY